jgi:hypothetical protein
MPSYTDYVFACNHAIDMKNITPKGSVRELLHTKIDQIEALDYAQLKEWVKARLSGKDAVLADMVGNSRAYPLVAIYPKLKRTAREDLQKACLELLNEFVSGRGLSGDAADDLLILSQGLFPERAGDRLRLFAEAAALFDKQPVELRTRVLQTLIALGEKMDPSFWVGCFHKDGKSIAPICFEGLAMHSVEDALEFLTHIGSEANVIDSILLHLPAFLERIMKCGQEKVFASAFHSRRNRLSAKLREEIVDLCEEMHIAQRPDSGSHWLGEHFDTQILLSSDPNGNGWTRRRGELILAAAL